MALILKDRVQETATANTTVSFSLAGASTGYQTFSAAIGNTNTTYYGASDGTNWEVGIGTYATTGNLLNRTTILSSSNAGSAVTFSGTVTVFVDYPSGKSVYLDASNNASALGTPAAFVATNVTGLPISTGVSGLGTGVATALGVNTGTAGAFVVNGGALGIPSSGTVTNLTGTASININGTVGATTANTGAFTNISSATAPTNTVPALALTGTPNNAAGGKTGVLGVGSNFTASDKNIMASFVQDINDYTQIVVQNPNAGASASADFIVNNNDTAGAGVYGDFGINSSAFSGTGSIGQASAVYLYSNGGDIVFGTNTANAVHFVTNAGATDAGSISSAGRWAINASGTNTTATALLHLGAGTATASTSPLKLTAGTVLTTAEAGAIEFDTANTIPYFTGNTTNGRGLIPATQYFRLTANGTNTTTTIAPFFGTNSSIPLVTNGVYEIEIECYYTKNTAGTLVWTLTNSAVVTNMTVNMIMSPVGGYTNVPSASATTMGALVTQTAAASAFAATASISSNAVMWSRFKIILENASSTSVRLNVTNSAGSITPIRGSFWKATRIANVGTYAA
jgi:hypothetical protein